MAASFTSTPTLAKRGPPLVVKPVIHEGVIYQVPTSEWGPKMGVLMATDQKTGKTLWEKKIYAVMINPKLEEDVQYIYIKSLDVLENGLLITNERGDQFFFDWKSKEVTKRKNHPHPLAIGKYEVLEMRDFSCSGMEGFTFQYPIFPRWEVKETRLSDKKMCVTSLNWPLSGTPTVQPSIIVTKHNRSTFSRQLTGKNPQGVLHKGDILNSFPGKPLFKFDKFAVFFTDDSEIKVELAGIGEGFSKEVFWEEVIESFRFQISEQDARKIALQIAEKNNFPSPTVKRQRLDQSKNKWEVEVTPGKYGPTDIYMIIWIDAVTGKVIDTLRGSRS